MNTEHPKPKSRKDRSIKNLILFPKYQFKIFFMTVISGFLLICMNSLVFYSFTKENYKILVDLSPMEDVVKHQLYLELNQIILLLTAASTASLILFGLLAIYLSHKTAGPLYRLKKEFKEIHSGKRGNKIFLREGDDFQEVMDDFNQVIDYLNKPN